MAQRSEDEFPNRIADVSERQDSVMLLDSQQCQTDRLILRSIFKMQVFVRSRKSIRDRGPDARSHQSQRRAGDVHMALQTASERAGRQYASQPPYHGRLRPLR